MPIPPQPLRPSLLACGLMLASVSLAANAEDTAPTDTIAELDAVRVREQRLSEQTAPGGQVGRSAKLGLLGSTDVMDAPFNITAYTSKVIEDQQSRTLAEVLQNDPSVRTTNSDGHAIENFQIRGFSVDSTEIAYGGLYGLASFGHVPTEFLERVEVLKGPGALLSGMAPSGGVGGVINLVPKRAGDQDLTRVTAGYVSDSYYTGHADISRRFGTDRRWGLRVNAAYGNGDTGVDDESKTRKLASAALDYRGEHGSASLDAFYTREQSDNGSSAMYGFSKIGKVIAAPDPKTNLLRGTYSDFESKTAVLRGEYALTPNWSAFAAIGGSRQDFDGYLYGTRVALTKTDGTAASTYTYHQRGYWHNTAGETGLRGQFRTGAVTHQVTLGLSYLQQIEYYKSVTSSKYSTNIYTPNENPLLAAAGTPVKYADNVFSSLALADVMGFLDDRVLLTVGARRQRVQQKMSDYDTHAVTPAVGVVFKPGNGPVSLYANYIEGLSAGTTISDSESPSDGKQFAPYKSKQKEIGVKWGLGDLTATISLFELTKPSLIQNATTLVYSADGQQRNRGMEWNVFGQIVPSVRVLGGMAYTQAKLTRTEDGEYAGNYAYGVPKWTANLGGEWDLPWVPGLTLTARTIYTGTQYLDSANTLQLPDWVRLDLGARYATQLGGKSVVFRFGVDNVANRRYWAGVFNEYYATVGAARTYSASVSFDF